MLSQTDGRYDGHWLWINDKANGRVAKIDLRTFEAAEIKVVPNIQGAHGLAAYLPTCKYVYVNGELEMDAVGNSTDAAKYRSMVAFLTRKRWRQSLKSVSWATRTSPVPARTGITSSSPCTTRRTRLLPRG